MLMAISFSEPKLKAFPFRPRSPRLAGLMQTCLFILAANWCLQGMRGMDRKELSFRLALELCLTLLIAAPRRTHRRRTARGGGGPAHRAHLQLHAQWADLGLRPLLPLVSPRPGRLGRFLRAVAHDLRGRPWLREAVCIGSLGRTGAAHGDRTDLDLRLLFPPGPLDWLRTNLLLLRLRTWALLGRIPLDLYAYERPERLRRFDQRERLMVLLDRDGRLEALYPRRVAPWP